MHKKTNYEENGENRTEISRKEKAQKKGVRGAIWFFVGCVIVSFIIRKLQFQVELPSKIVL